MLLWPKLGFPEGKEGGVQVAQFPPMPSQGSEVMQMAELPFQKTTSKNLPNHHS